MVALGMNRGGKVNKRDVQEPAIQWAETIGDEACAGVRVTSTVPYPVACA